MTRLDQADETFDEVPSSTAATGDYRHGNSAGRTDPGTTDDASRPAKASGGSVDLDAPLTEADFQLVRPLGAGGMGEVYEAFQKSLRKPVALKLIKREALESPSRVRRFFAEARALARLRHPHIVGVTGIGRMADGRYFLVMDLVEEGTTLADLLDQGPVAFDRAAALVATVAEAIEHAHSRSVIHRDLKPSNVLLDAEGKPHVTDFGLAKVFDAADPDNPHTTADQILGTPHYMAPEQADAARGPISPRTDVFALGGLLYALLTGKPPLQGDSLTAILTRLISPEPVPSPRELRSDVPAALEQICRTCLEKDVDNRYASASAVATALRSWLADPDLDRATALPGSQPGRRKKSSDDRDAGESGDGSARDRSLITGRKTSSPRRTPAKSFRSARRRRMIWAGGAGVWTLALLFVAGTVAFRSYRMRPPESHVAAPTPPRPSIADSVPAPPRAITLRPVSNLPEPIASWDVHVYRPDADGKTWLDLGNMLVAPVTVRSGDRLKLKASFREPLYAVVLAINPDGSVQRLGAPVNTETEHAVTELSIPPGVDRYIRLTRSGPTALLLLASRQRLVVPAEIATRAFAATAWRTSRAEKAWIFDGQGIVPVLKMRAIEETVGTSPFASVCEALKANPDLAGRRAVVFEVLAPK